MNEKKPLIGITGIIGSGKTTVAKLLGEFGGSVFDADVAAKKAAQKPEVLLQIREKFSENLLTANGELNRSKMAELVFQNSDQLIKLNQIIHPHVREQMWEFVSRNHKDPACTMIIIDAPLIYETDLYKHLDQIIVVTADQEACINRVKKRNNLTREQILTRMAAQIPLSEKIKKADFQINNDQNLSDLIPRLKKIYQNIVTNQPRRLEGSKEKNDSMFSRRELFK